MRSLYRDFDTQAQIDAQYNAGLTVADPQVEFRHYARQAERARAQLRCTLDVAFGPTRDETLDVFPADRPGAPIFVFVHGGYWRAFSSKDFSGVAQRRTAKAGELRRMTPSSSWICGCR